jgi:hypothetical protein
LADNIHQLSFRILLINGHFAHELGLLIELSCLLVELLVSLVEFLGLGVNLEVTLTQFLSLLFELNSLLVELLVFGVQFMLLIV